MKKLDAEQINALKSLPYWNKVNDLVNLYEKEILSQEEFKQELLRIRGEFKRNTPNFPKVSPSKKRSIGSSVEMVSIEGDQFQLRSNINYIAILSDFLISKYPIMQELYKSIIGSNPSHFQSKKNPVESISWYDAIEFCNELSHLEGLEKCYSGSKDNIRCNFQLNGYRLPTEAEWIFAARGGRYSKSYDYSGGNNPNNVVWNSSNSNGSTQPVGLKNSNELGLYDMSGNVYEWCWDWKEDYPNITENNPKGPLNGEGRVIRGGSWWHDPEFSNILYKYKKPDFVTALTGNPTDIRGVLYPNDKNYFLGFRITRTLK
ncbi:MAG: SUMF1/EgtB/PvdO family nonheme iron enzyme [Candidatus Delongbacteria bacterium]|jgi:sulfatase modifying factor 1|nr:SUMF1/EgtB/PvdO family nonheme iron enzyme [Candidatus Delongbacteria bacterium]